MFFFSNKENYRKFIKMKKMILLRFFHIFYQEYESLKIVFSIIYMCISMYFEVIIFLSDIFLLVVSLFLEF